jgi:hypothetical protein
MRTLYDKLKKGVDKYLEAFTIYHVNRFPKTIHVIKIKGWKNGKRAVTY